MHAFKGNGIRIGAFKVFRGWEAILLLAILLHLIMPILDKGSPIDPSCRTLETSK